MFQVNSHAVMMYCFIFTAAAFGLSEPVLSQPYALSPEYVNFNNQKYFIDAPILGRNGGRDADFMFDALEIFGRYSKNGISPSEAAPTDSTSEGTTRNLLALRLARDVNDLSSEPDLGIMDKIPFGNTAVKTFLYSHRTHPQASLLGTAAIIRETKGSGTFGPGANDFGLLISNRKDDWPTSKVDGEVNGLIVIGRQGQKGDSNNIVLESYKRRNNLTKLEPDESGGGGLLEGRVGLVDAKGRVFHRMHAIIGFGESPGGVSGGRGYGTYMETRGGTWFSAYHASSMSEPDDSNLPSEQNGWMWYFTGSKNRNPGSLNYGVDSEGRVHSGAPLARMSFGFDAKVGAMTLRNETANTTTAQFSKSGGLRMEGQYVDLILSDPVTGMAGGGAHRITSSGNGTFFYQVSGAANSFDNAVTAWSVAPNGIFSAPHITSARVTMSGLLKLNPYTVATLPKCDMAIRDAIAVVTDAAGPTYHGRLIGGGSVRTPAYCDGRSWAAH